MPRHTENALTDRKIQNAKPTNKQFKLFDGKGLFLLIHPNGSKYFRWDYSFEGKRKTLALGVYPETTLKQAREERLEAQKTLVSMSKRTGMTVSQVADEVLYTGLIEMQELDAQGRPPYALGLSL